MRPIAGVRPILAKPIAFARRATGMMMRGLYLLLLVAAATWLPIDAPAQRGPAAPPLPLPPPAAATANPAPGELFRDCPDCPELVVVPPGEFDMGGDNPFEKPVHRVAIARPYAIGRREVTFAQWDQCVAADACKHRPDDHGWGRGEQPVINVSWDDTKVYLAWLSQKTGQRYRLPTEAEWEYAARAGSEGAFAWGDDAGKNLANCDGCGSRWDNRQTAPVGSFAPNAFGLSDMHGNAWEWVEDCYRDNYDGAPTDGTAVSIPDCPAHLLRGGSWYNHPVNMRAAVRNWFRRGVQSETRHPDQPDTPAASLGLRVARTLAR
jgi:formylglycine-generating enzyme required for sulfatase activity